MITLVRGTSRTRETTTCKWKVTNLQRFQYHRPEDDRSSRIKREISKTIAISEKTSQVGKLVSRADKDKVVTHL